MRKNEVYCHQQLAKAAAVNEHLQNHHASLKNLLSESEADRLTLQEFERDVQADMLLDKRKPLWEKAVSIGAVDHNELVDLNTARRRR